MGRAKLVRMCSTGEMRVTEHAGIAVRVLVAVSLLAITGGVLLPKVAPKRKIPTAFDEVGPGRIEGNRYVSDFFGFSIEPPAGWYLESRKVLRRRLQKEKGSDRENVAFMLLVFKFPWTSRPSGSFNSGIFVLAERLSNMPGVRTADEYLLACLKQREEKTPQHGKPKGPYKRVVGGKDFYGLDCKFRLQGRMADTSHLAIIKRDYARSTYAVWGTQEDRRVLAKVRETVRLE